jgi:hydroxyacyl-ACP dehydratase HTD2-like protein with hotdog domain
MPSSEGLIHFALFSALFHLLDGHTSLAPHPLRKKSRVFCYGRVGFTQTISLSSQSFFLCVCKSILYIIHEVVESASLSVTAKTLSHRQDAHFSETALCSRRRTLILTCGQPLKGAVPRQSPAVPRSHETREDA